MKKSHKYLRAFTLVELLVVIAIIAILAGIIMTNLVSSRSKARDAERISDLGQIQLAIELFYDRCKQYPAAPLNVDTEVDCASSVQDLKLKSYIDKIPTSPSPGSYGYAVIGTPPSDYRLYVTLENDNEILKNSATADSFSITCYNGSNKAYCLSPK